ncbi:MAG TPA: alpha/beta fold hydrolase [Streptosporangiaceae bacterium]|nr:alpha/beta fold hydrolase [Streptosporangiaceae bacterium]
MSGEAMEGTALSGEAMEGTALSGEAMEGTALSGGAPESTALSGGAPESTALSGGAPESTALSGGAPESTALSGTGDWFVSGGGAAPWSTRIFCFPHAGGSPRAFLDWQPGLGTDAEIFAVCRPGREHRAAEPAPTIEEFVDGAAEAVATVTAADGRPFYLFGHSLGALVAFEVCRKLSGLAELRHFIASGISAPSLLPSQRVKDIARLSGIAFAEAIGFFGGLPAEVIADEEVRELLLPSLIADFDMAVGYRYQPGPRLQVPAVIVVGRDDPHVGAAEIEPWNDEFTSPPERYLVDGGHFYFEPEPAPIIGILRSLVDADQHVELI